MKEFLLKKMALPTIVLFWAVSYYVEVMAYSVKNHRLIQPIFWVMAVLYIINGITDYREWKQIQAGRQSGQAENKLISSRQTVKVAAVIIVMAAYVALLGLLGFVTSTFLFAGAVQYLMGERKWYRVVCIPLVLVAFLYLVFRIGLSIPLPTGFLGA